MMQIQTEAFWSTVGSARNMTSVADLRRGEERRGEERRGGGRHAQREDSQFEKHAPRERISEVFN